MCWRVPWNPLTHPSSLRYKWGWWRRYCSHEALSVIDVVYSSGWASPGAIVPFTVLRRSGCVCGAATVLVCDLVLIWRTRILLLGRLWRLQKKWNVVRRLFNNCCKAVWLLCGLACFSTYTVSTIVCCGLHVYLSLCVRFIWLLLEIAATTVTQAKVSELLFIIIDCSLPRLIKNLRWSAILIICELPLS